MLWCGLPVRCVVCGARCAVRGARCAVCGVQDPITHIWLVQGRAYGMNHTLCELIETLYDHDKEDEPNLVSRIYALILKKRKAPLLKNLPKDEHEKEYYTKLMGTRRHFLRVTRMTVSPRLLEQCVCIVRVTLASHQTHAAPPPHPPPTAPHATRHTPHATPQSTIPQPCKHIRTHPARICRQ